MNQRPSTSKYIQSMDHAFWLLRNNPKAILYGDTKELSQEINSIVIKTPLSITSQSALGLQLDSELKPIFDYYLTLMKETGVVDMIKKSVLFKRYHMDLEQNETNALGYRNLLFPFMILGFGAGFSLVCFVIELVRRLTPFS